MAPPIASSASLLFNYFIPKGFSEQLFLKPKGSYKKKEATKKMRCCSPCHIALICINRYLFFYARHLHFRLPETGYSPQPRHTGQLRPARRGTLLDVAHDDRRVAGSARRFGPKRYTADFRGLLPERWSIAEAISQIVRWIISCAPFGVLGLVFTTISQQGIAGLPLLCVCPSGFAMPG